MTKKSVFAMLALAMMLGVAVPSAGAFASEGTLEVQNAGDGETTDEKTEGTALEASYVLSFAELYNRVQTSESFKEYRDNKPLVDAYVVLVNASSNAKMVLEDVPGYSAGGVHIKVGDDKDKTFKSEWNTKLSDTTKTAISNVKFYNAIATLKKDPLYSSDAKFKKFIDDEEISINAAKAVVVQKLSAAYPTEAATIQAMSLDDLMKKFDEYVKGEENFAPWLVLSAADDELADEGFVTTTADGTKILNTTEMMKKYNEDKIAEGYIAYATAAAQIDPEATKGLAPYKLPDTSVGTPEAPDSGLISMLEEGSVDVGVMVTVILAAVATIAGAGFIAKLYIKHKF